MNKLKSPLIIVANGEFPSHSTPLEILEKSNYILACDGAADTLIDKGYIPNIILGDLDSISHKNKIKYSSIIIKSESQFENDLRKAINFAQENNIKDIKILGASGKREDHLIGNIFSLLDYNKTNIELFTDQGVFTCIHKNQKIDSFKGQQISIFALDSTIKIKSNNLKYNFNNNSITTIYIGTLNESTSNYFNINISHGSLLIFRVYN